MKKYVFYAGIACCIMLFVGTAAAISPVETAHFRVVANGQGLKAADLKKVGEEVEGVYDKVSDALGIGYTSSGKIEVRVYVTPEKGRALKTAASRSTIFLTLGRIDDETLWSILTYMIISKPLSTAPRWFYEGLAMYSEHGNMRDTYNKALPLFSDFSFTKLEAKFGASNTYNDACLYSWAVVSYVAGNYGKDKLKSIFKGSGNFSDKFSKAFGVNLRSIEKNANAIFATYK